MTSFHPPPITALIIFTSLVATLTKKGYAQNPQHIACPFEGNDSNNITSPTGSIICRKEFRGIIWDVLKNQVPHCGLKSVVLISDDAEMSRQVLQFTHSMNLPLILRDGDSSNTPGVRDWFRQVYANRSADFFLVAVDRPEVILQEAEVAFVQRGFGPLSAFPHRTQWLVLCRTEGQRRRVARQQFRSLLDNVALIMLKPTTHTAQDNSSKSGGQGHSQAVTFMWRENRTRLPVPVSFAEIPWRSCVLFPNRNLGMNGRRLTVEAKEFLEIHLARKPSPLTGEIEVVGLLMDVLEYSSESLNFTYEIVTGIDPDGFYSINWYDYIDKLANGSVDIGLSAWSNLYTDMYPNMSFSYPVIFDKVVGVYRRPGRLTLHDSLGLICPFSSKVYLFLFLCLVYTTSFYAVVIKYFYASEEDELIREDYPCSGILNLHKDYDDGNSGILDVVQYLPRYLEIMSSFGAAILNQAYLPQPRQMSARIVIGIWAVGLVFYYAIFSSLITAEMVGYKEELPITTIQQLIERTDYRCTAILDSTVADIVTTAELGPLVELNKKLTLISIPLNGAVDGTGYHHLETMDANTVFLYFETVIQDWIQRLPNPDGYYIMQSDPLFYTGLSLVYAANAEINDLMSESFLDFHESGLLSRFLEMNSVYLQSKRPSGVVLEKGVFNISSMFWFFVICSIQLGLSCVVLFIEICIHNHKRTCFTKRMDGKTIYTCWQ